MSVRIKTIVLCLTIITTTVTIYISALAKPTLTENSSQATEIRYYLSEFEGNLAIYKTNSPMPIEILDVRISSLPERDIERIKNGITANSLAEIIKIAEDYE